MANLSRPTLATLPEELLSSILAYLPSPALHKVLPTSHRLHDAALYLLSQRYAHVTRALNGFDLIFECYPPAARMDTSYNHCIYASTASRSQQPDLSHPAPTSPASAAAYSAHLRSLYTTFVPTTPTGKPTSIHLSLDADEPFAQLMASIFLARAGPRRGLFSAVAHMPGESERVFRVKREWLDCYAGQKDEERMVWVDAGRNFGVRVAVHREAEGEWTIAYEAVVVRTGKVVEAMEGWDGKRGQEGRGLFYCWPYVAHGPALVMF